MSLPCAKKQSTSAIFSICLAGVFWGTSGTALSFAPDGAQASVFGVFRLVVCGLFLAAVLLLKKAPPKKQGWSVLPLLSASAAMASMQICFFEAISRAGVAVGTTIFIGSYPIFAGIFGYLLRNEKPGMRWGGATILSIVGVSFMTLGSVAVDNDLFGIFLALGAGASYALYSVFVKGLLSQQSSIAVMAATSLVGSIILSPVLLVCDVSWVFYDFQRVSILALYLGVMASACPLLLFAKGLRHVHVATAATLNLVEPLTATLLGIIFLHESLAQASWIGMTLLVFGVLWLSTPALLFNRS